jgi:Divergent InlB B-repeat domain
MTFTFILTAPGISITEPEYHPAAQADGIYKQPVTGLAPGTTYDVGGKLRDPNGPWPVHQPNTGAVHFRTLARLDVFKRGEGRVASDPAGIDCGSVCGVDLPVGGGFSLTATPAPGYRFGHWGGDGCSGTAPTCADWVTTWNRTTAVFAQASLITVTRSGSGSGVVTSATGGLSCGGTCSATFDPGQSVTLTATPDAGSRFGRWSGACAGSAVTCTFTPAVGASTVDAAFVKLATLSVHKRGHGTVSDEAGSIHCGATCTATVDDGSSATLHARPARRYRFAGWSGSCTGKALTCTLTVSGAETVNARFKAKPKKKRPR